MAATPRFTADELTRIYRDTASALYRFVSQRTGGDRQLSEDVVQEAYLRAVRSWSESGPAEEPLSWLRTVARNLLVNYYRSRQPVGLDPVCIDRALDDRGVDSSETACLLHWALGQIRPDDARFIEAFHLDGRSTKHIATETGLSSKAVEGRLYRARRALHDLLAPHVSRNGEQQ